MSIIDHKLKSVGAMSMQENRALTRAPWETRLWLAQRISAAVLAICVLIHLITMIFAVQGGLTAAEILDRTRDNFPALIFYALFVVAVTVHAPLGLRVVCREWLGWRRGLAPFLIAYAGVLLILGFSAIVAVFAGI